MPALRHAQPQGAAPRAVRLLAGAWCSGLPRPTTRSLRGAPPFGTGSRPGSVRSTARWRPGRRWWPPSQARPGRRPPALLHGRQPERARPALRPRLLRPATPRLGATRPAGPTPPGCRAPSPRPRRHLGLCSLRLPLGQQAGVLKLVLGQVALAEPQGLGYCRLEAALPAAHDRAHYGRAGRQEAPASCPRPWGRPGHLDRGRLAWSSLARAWSTLGRGL